MVSAHLAVLGSPVAHSKSPSIHAAAYEFLGLDWDYARYDITERQLEGFLALRDSSWLGFSVTMPLKDKAFELSTALSNLAKKSESVNTLVNSGEAWVGYNTDVFGIRQAIQQKDLIAVGSVAVIGSGATARSAVLALNAQFPSAEITVHARNVQNAQVMLDRLEVDGAVKELSQLGDYDVTVSTLPANAFVPHEKQAGLLLDVAYDPWPSKASLSYEDSISGLEMLLWQAIGQLRIFTGGDENRPLADEMGVMTAMRNAL